MIKRVVRAVVVAAMSLSTVGPCAVAGDNPVPPMVRQSIESVLKDKGRKLADERDKDGFGYKRGTYSKTFQRVDDSTYTVGYIQDTLEPASGNETTQLRTERFELTLKRDLAGKWSIAKQEKKDDVVELYRGYFGVPWVYRFDSLSFEKEGLKVSATNGYAYASRLLDKTGGFHVFADDLKFDFEPPAGASQADYYRVLDVKLARDHPDDLVFKPESLSINCDPKSCDEFMTRVFAGLKQLGSGESSGGTGAMARMRKALDDETKDTETDRKDNPFAGLRLPPDQDNRYWSFTFKRQGMKEHYAGLSYDDFEPWQVSFSATGYGNLFAYYSEDMRGKIDPYILEQREDQAARDFDLTGLVGSVDLGLDDPTAVSGDITYTLKTKLELKRLPFFIARERVDDGDDSTKDVKLFINSIQDDNGNELTWTRLFSFGGLVIFQKPIPAGTVVKLRLQFTNYDAIYQLNPSFFGLSRGGWLPLVRLGDFIDSLDLTTRLPDKYQILGVGKLVSETVKDGIRTSRWVSPSPVNFPTVIFGDYISDDAGDYKATKIDGTEIPVRVYVDRGSTAQLTDQEGASAGARDIRGKQLRAVATQAAVALNLFKEIYGVDYPFAKLDVIADPVPQAGVYAQAPASMVFLHFRAFRGQGQVAERGGSYVAKLNRDTVSHECGHQWWAHVVTFGNFRNYWFIESLAELSSAVYVERTQGKKKYLDKVADWRLALLEYQAEASVQDGTAIWAGDGRGEAVTNIYAKGPYAFHVFRSTFGDEKFFALLKALAQQFQRKAIVTRDIQEVMEQVVGGNMDWFFDQWIRGVGIPQYAIFWTKRKNEQGKWIVEGSIKQRVVMGEDKTELKGVYYRGVAPLTFIDLNGKEVKSAKPMLVQGAETPFKLIVADEPEQVFFNKDGEILAEDLLINQSW
jgi:hypothetical protein